jgi:hypothetical protein
VFVSILRNRSSTFSFFFCFGFDGKYTTADVAAGTLLLLCEAKEGKSDISTSGWLTLLGWGGGGLVTLTGGSGKSDAPPVFVQLEMERPTDSDGWD